MQLDQNTTLINALGAYMTKTVDVSNNQTQQELTKFARWCGYDRMIGSLTPSEVGKYAEMVGSYVSDSSEKLEIIRGFLGFVNKEGLAEQNLAQHARFRKTRNKRLIGSKIAPQSLVELTAGGHSKLKKRLELLKTQDIGIVEDIRKAAADKDVRENAPLDAAREQQGQIQAQIKELEKTLRSAVIISKKRDKKQQFVRIGSLVELRDLRNKQRVKYHLVNSNEANPLDGKLSTVSPVGKALLNQQLGTEIEVNTPGGLDRYLVLKIS